MFAAARTLSEAEEIGLWGELWTLDRSTLPGSLLPYWRGPEGGVADFFVDGAVLEVKTGRQPGRHHVSQTQVIAADRNGWLLSLLVEHTPTGPSVASLADHLASRFGRSALFEGMSQRGISPSVVERGQRGYSLIGTPSVFLVADVPRVRAADPGVGELRYVVTLDPERALRGQSLREALGTFGLVA